MDDTLFLLGIGLGGYFYHQQLKEPTKQTPVEPQKTIYFIDVENVGCNKISKLLSENNTRHIIMVTGIKNNAKLTPEMSWEMSSPTSRIQIVCATKVERDLADKILSAKIGECKERFPHDKLRIQSNDKGFNQLVKSLKNHWQGIDLDIIN